MLGTLITPRVQRWLRNVRRTRILHIFTGACNLVNDQNEVISLVSPRIGPGPFTIVLESDGVVEVDVHQPVSIDGDRQILTVGSLVVDAGKALLWQPVPDWTQLRDADMAHWPPPTGLPPHLDAYLSQTITGVATNDSSMCLAGVEGLAGRGTGLTPAGDDVLMGIVYGLWVWYPSHPPRRSRQEWLEMIVETAVPRTTTLSANFLRAAAEGEAVRQWHDLVNGCSGAIDQILAIGHTSGADAWAGFVRASTTLNSRPAHHL